MSAKTYEIRTPGGTIWMQADFANASSDVLSYCDWVDHQPPEDDDDFRPTGRQVADFSHSPIEAAEWLVRESDESDSEWVVTMRGRTVITAAAV